MSDFLKNRGVSTFFLIDALVPRHIDRLEIMRKIAEIFCLDDDADELYQTCSARAVAEIVSVADYNRYLRLRQLSALGISDVYSRSSDENADELISVKGKILAALEQSKILTSHYANSVDVLINLAEKASGGLVIALYAYGVILCGGLGVEKNLSAGLENLKKAADWNCIEACVMCLYYSQPLREKYGNKLYTYLLNTPYARDMEILSGKYSLSPGKDEIAALTCKLFSNNVAVNIQYNHQVARILECGVLSEPDKQDIVLSGGKDLIKAVNSLPLNLVSWGDYQPDCSRLPFGESEQNRKIATALRNIDTLESEKYTPLCLCSGERYVLDAYRRALAEAFDGCNIIFVNLAECSEDALESTANNIVLRSIKESKPNVAVFIADDGEKLLFSQKLSGFVFGFIRGEARKAYKLRTGISLNLTSVLPVLLCDKECAKLFRDDCQVIKLKEMTRDDRKMAIEQNIEDNKQLYELASLVVREDAMELLLDKKSNLATAIIDKFCLGFEDGQDAVLTVGDINRILDSADFEPSLGFKASKEDN